MKFILLISLFFSVHSLASVKTPSTFDKKVDLPIKKLSAIESENQIYYVSSNGRYVLIGQMYDLWNKTTLDSMDQIEESATRIHLDKMNFKISDLNMLQLGTGDKDIVAFIDPNGKPSIDFVKKVIENKDSSFSKFTFKFVIIPALGDNSNIIAKKIFCVKDVKSHDEILQLLINNQINSLPIPECNTQNYDKTLVTATILQIQEVPFIIANDGRFSKGLPNKLPEWLFNITNEVK